MFFNSTTKTIMKKIILASLLFSLATLANAIISDIDLSFSTINENADIDTIIGVATASGDGSGTYSYTVQDFNAFSFGVASQGGFNYGGGNDFKVRPAGGDGSNDITIATINFGLNVSSNPASDLAAAINALTTTTGVSAIASSSEQVALTGWPVDLYGATLIGFDLNNPAGNFAVTIKITSTGDDLIIPTNTASDFFSIGTATGVLISKVEFDYEAKSTYNIIIRATDSTGGYSENFDITIIDDPNDGLTLSLQIVAEHNAVGATVGILATDGGTGPYTYTLSSERDFEFAVGTTNLGGTSASNDFRVRAADGGATLTIATVTNFATGGANYKPAGTLVEAINAKTDDTGFSAEIGNGYSGNNGNTTGTVNLTSWPDAYNGGELIGFSTGNFDYITIVYHHSSHPESTPGNKFPTPDSSYFSTDGDKLITTAVLDQATQSSYTITINSTDANNTVISRDFKITVADGPSGTVTGITLAPNTINNQAADGTTVGLLSTNATDTGRVYVLVDNTATFSISDDKLTANNPNTLQIGTISVSISTYNEATDSFPSYTVIITVIEEKTFSLDVDGNGTINAPNDGLIIFKYLLNSNANNLHTTIASDTPDGRKTTPQLKAYLDDAGTILDVDGNGTINAPNDGLIIFKYLLNSNANNLHTTIASDAPDSKKTTPQLKAYLDLYSE